MRKQCTSCKIEKDIKEFYKRKNGLHGRHAECKTCLKFKNKIYRKENPEKIRIKEKLYIEKLRSTYPLNFAHHHILMHERSIIGFNRYANKKMQNLACNLLNYAIRIKLINKPDRCSICKKETLIQGHHPDYSKPLEVVWTCIECHAKFHTTK